MTDRPANDVRMRGFARRSSVDEAWAWIEQEVNRLGGETIEYSRAAGRVLAAPVLSPLDVPRFDRSAMDGYAVQARDTEGASDYNPLPLTIVGESLPAQPFEGSVSQRQAVRIMTGAPVPGGADAVLPVEYAQETGDRVEISQAVPPGKHVGRRGEDVREGAELLATGRRLRPQDVALLASVGIERVDVVRKPRVRLLITGNELIAPGEPLGEYQIYESNSAMLVALVERDGGEIESLRRLEDRRDAIRAALTEPGADVLIVSGGSSVGQEDHAPSLVAETGELAIHGIAMRPSSPSGMGRIDGSLVFLVPGNPVSCLCAYDFFVRKALQRLGGRADGWPYRLGRATLSKKITSLVGRVDYCRVKLIGESVTPLALSGASNLSSTTRADGFAIVPGDLEGYPAGAEIDVWSYDNVPAT